MKKIRILLLLLIATVFVSNSIFFWLIFIWLFFAFTNYLKLKSIKKRLSFHLDLNRTEVERGNPFKIEVKLHNDSLFPISNGQMQLTVFNEHSKSEVLINWPIEIAAKSEKVIQFPHVFEEIGACTITLEQFEEIGFFQKKYAINDEQIVFVLPKTYEIADVFQQQLLNHTSETTEKYQVSIKNKEERFGIRPYVKGDRINQIHWKLSSKVDELVIVESHEQIQSDVVAYLKMEEATPMQQTLLIEVYLSVLLVLQQKGIRSHFWMNDQNHFIEHMTIKQITYDILQGATLGVPNEVPKNAIIISNDQQLNQLYSQAHHIVLQERRVHAWAITESHLEEDLKVLGKEVRY
ncbi:DUF58 domain-containing protein [Kurthia sibirica]|uniref:Uncharacterized protein n=1 Tax=Kurthia sibirica TaxID=202750 RepID=A0A2U3ALE1_9BACL|nr:DUF58 domain-containing protein [Kurthia sibirica]PWI25346.1 hypothetical protein DEX24_08370 [Kurthia sibirica]GEK34408.1 hypothetical protein KSI01_19410 [Kurthia sibirica]